MRLAVILCGLVAAATTFIPVTERFSFDCPEGSAPYVPAHLGLFLPALAIVLVAIARLVLARTPPGSPIPRAVVGRRMRHDTCGALRRRCARSWGVETLLFLANSFATAAAMIPFVFGALSHHGGPMALAHALLVVLVALAAITARAMHARSAA